VKKHKEIDPEAHMPRTFAGIDRNFGIDVGNAFRAVFPTGNASLNEMIALLNFLWIPPLTINSLDNKKK
jgi:hypothetical protein